MKVTRHQLRRIIREAVGRHPRTPEGPQGPGILLTRPTGRVEVEWDFYLGDGDDWDNLSYEEQEAEAGMPPVVNIPPDTMEEYHALAGEYGDSQAQQVITDWLSDKYDWLHQGWSWV